MKLLRWLLTFLVVLVVLGAAGAGGVAYSLYHYSKGLPEHKQLADYEPPTMTRLHAGNGRLLAEYAIERRVFVPVEAVPRRVINAFSSAEDQNFYSHKGVDPWAIARAAISGSW